MAPPSGARPTTVPASTTTNQPSVDDHIRDFRRILVDAKKQMETMKKDPGKFRKASDQCVAALLLPATQICNLLDGVAGLYPAVGVVSKSLSIIIAMEKGRRENDGRIVAVYPQIALRLFVLTRLKEHAGHDIHFKEQLEEELKRIEGTFSDFAKFCDTFYKPRPSKTLYHLVHSLSEKEKLLDITSSFDRHEQVLTILLNVKASDQITRIEAAIKSLSESLAGSATPEERRAEELLQTHGGEDGLRTNTLFLHQFAAAFGQPEVSAELRRTVAESLEEAINSNSGLFNLRFDAMQKDQNEMKETADNTYKLLEQELRDGPFIQLQDDEMKSIWKGTGVSTHSGTVKRRLFVQSVGDSYRLKFKKYKHESRAEHKDAWTAYFLTKVSYHAAIGDAIDEDGSGYIAVSELNHFLSQKPAAWSSPEWFAYWAYGWTADMEEYSQEIVKAISVMGNMVDKVPESFKTMAQDFLTAVQKQVASVILKFCYDPQPSPPEAQETKMDALRGPRRKQLSKAMDDILSQMNYMIEDDTSITTVLRNVTGNMSLESVLLILLTSFLRNCLAVFKKAKSQEVLEDTFHHMKSSFDVIFESAQDRVKELRSSWRQNRMDIDDQFTHYFGGIFAGIWLEQKATLTTYEDAYRQLYDDDAEESEEGEDDDENEGSGAEDKTQAVQPNGNKNQVQG
ncbi:hypothetical protein K439DRAFT_751585 [Ramaria rubella]|nr:hypothetical protein K439DRAFT_751585 [Ramaria rubella]